MGAWGGGVCPGLCFLCSWCVHMCEVIVMGKRNLLDSDRAGHGITRRLSDHVLEQGSSQHAPRAGDTHPT